MQCDLSSASMLNVCGAKLKCPKIVVGLGGLNPTKIPNRSTSIWAQNGLLHVVTDRSILYMGGSHHNTVNSGPQTLVRKGHVVPLAHM